VSYENPAIPAVSNQMMKILLVYPETPDTFWSFKHVLRFISTRAAFPPVGLLTVAAMLPADWLSKINT
jgi:hypothetical protein